MGITLGESIGFDYGIDRERGMLSGKDTLRFRAAVKRSRDVAARVGDSVRWSRYYCARSEKGTPAFSTSIGTIPKPTLIPKLQSLPSLGPPPIQKPLYPHFLHEPNPVETHYGEPSTDRNDCTITTASYRDKAFVFGLHTKPQPHASQPGGGRQLGALYTSPAPHIRSPRIPPSPPGNYAEV